MPARNPHLEVNTAARLRRPSREEEDWQESELERASPSYVAKKALLENSYASRTSSSRLSAQFWRPAAGRTPQMIFKPRFLFVLLICALSSLLLLSATNRNAAAGALTRAGIPLPHKLPDLGISRGLAGWTSRWATAGSDKSNFGLDEDGFSAGQKHDLYEDTAAIIHPADPVADAVIGEPLEHIGHVSTESDGYSEKPIEVKDQPVYHPTNGYLVLPDHGRMAQKPLTRHPIIELRERAQREWDAKVDRQSKTLEDAVREYKRRYKRPPPVGFDKWFAYAEANKVVLTDEYDQIHKDMQPFWALAPDDLEHRSIMMTVRDQTFTITVDPKKSTPVSYSGEEAKLRRASDLGKVIGLFAADLPLSLNLTFTRHDQPACAMGWGHKDKMVEMASMGEFFGPSEFVETEDPALTNWANGCAPSSPLRKSEMGDLGPQHVAHPDQLSSHRSFVYDHSAAMDVCQHPEWMALHGFTAAPGTTLGELVPLFTFAKTTVHSDILATPLEQFSDTYIGVQPDWADKKYNTLMWRGSTTGVEFRTTTDWQLSQRARMHFMTHETEGTRTVLLAGADGRPIEKEFPTRVLNEAWMNAAFSGEPLQCDKETCELMHEIITFAPTMGLQDSYEYKYLVDIDGNGWSGRFHRLMSTKSCVIKTTIFPEWYSDRVQPWLHYVPLKVDYSDLYDIMAYFVGDPVTKENAHDEDGHAIAEAGRDWALHHWRREDMAAYMFRLCLEWARILHRNEVDDPAMLDFVLQ